MHLLTVQLFRVYNYLLLYEMNGSEIGSLRDPWKNDVTELPLYEN